MGALNKLKQLGKKQKEIAKQNLLFKAEMLRQKYFFAMPTKIHSFKLVASTAISLIITKVLNGEKTKAEIKSDLQLDSNAKAILKYTSTDLDNEILSDMILQCYNTGEEFNLDQYDENLSPEELMSKIDQSNDIDSKIGKITEQLAAGLGIAFASKDIYNTYTTIIHDILHKTQDLISKTDHPSKYRTKYLQKYIRTTYGLIKLSAQSLAKEYTDKLNNLLNALKQIDTLITTLTMLSTLYIVNRIKLHKLSKQALDKISSETACLAPTIEPFDVNIPKKLFEINFNCAVEKDDLIVPHIPLEEKLKNIATCETSQNEETINDITNKEDIVTMAVIKNTKKDNLILKVNKDSFVNSESLLANLGRTQIYSPVVGYVDQLLTNEIVLRDISEPDQSFITKIMDELNSKFQQINDIKSFLKDYNTISLYPEMLSIAILDDSSTLNNPLLTISSQFKQSLNDNDDLVNAYNRDMQAITGKDNVEKHAKNETLNEFKIQIERRNEEFYKGLKLIEDRTLNRSKLINITSKDYVLIDYYLFDLAPILNSVNSPSKLVVTYRDLINEYSTKRYYLDKFSKAKIKSKIKDYLKDIEKGITNAEKLFDQSVDIYNSTKKTSELKKWLVDIANRNKKLNESERTTLVNKLMYLYEFYFNIDDTTAKKYTQQKLNSKIETVKEGNAILKIFSDCWKQYFELQTQIDDLFNKLNVAYAFKTYSIIEYEGKEARLYVISDEPDCVPVEKNDYINPKSKYGYGDIEYWLRYCAGATLASVANPATGWSTGWLTPTPILFPVVYVPIKSIETTWGFIVIGISICGIYVYPWILTTNLSTNYTTLFGDPTQGIKNEITALKKEITQLALNLKKDVIKKMLDDIKPKLDSSKNNLVEYKKQLKENQLLKPKKYDFENDALYLIQLEKWAEKNLELNELILTEKLNLWKTQAKYKSLQESYKFDKPAKGVSESVEQSEKIITDKLDNLSRTVDAANKALASLPISIEPETTNFGMTLKNPSLVIQITDQLDDNINFEILKPITDKFELKNSDLMSKSYQQKLNLSVVNFNQYKDALIASMPILVIKDAFPKYELLNPTNIAWSSFLYGEFSTIGAATFGFPGFAPYPIPQI